MVHVVSLEPYDAKTGLLVPLVAQRMLDFVQEHTPEVDARKFVRGYMMRLWGDDPTVKILALVSEKGALIGHVAASLEADGDLADPATNRWVFVSQAKVDDNIGDARKVVMAMLDDFGRQHGTEEMLMVAGKNERTWEKTYGFRTARRVMRRAIGTPVLEATA